MAQMISIVDLSGTSIPVNINSISYLEPRRVVDESVNTGAFITDGCIVNFLNNATPQRTIATLSTVAQVQALIDAAEQVAGGIKQATVTLTNAQVLALATTPITLVGAPGSGLKNSILQVELTPSGASAALAGGNLQIKQGSSGILYAQGASTINTLNRVLVPTASGVNSANTAITIDAASTLTVFTGGTLTVQVLYVTLLA